jgi:HK97 family phage major capsid protein
MNLTASHKADLATFEIKSKEYKQFLTENEATLGSNSRLYSLATTMNSELKSLKTRLEGHVKSAGLQNDAADFTSYIADPGDKAGAAARSMGMLGTVQDGHTDIDAATKSLLSQIGGGIIGDKAWDGIHDPAYKKAFDEYLRKGQRMSDWAWKNLEVGLDAQAGQLAPIDWIQKLIQRAPTPTRVAGMVTTMTTGRDAIVMPKINYNSATDDASGNLYTTGFRVTGTEENPSSDIQSLVADSNLTGSIRIDNNTWLIEGVLTNNMVEDSAIDVMSWTQGKFQQTSDLLKDNMIFNGTGLGQPMGMVPNMATGSPADGQIQAYASGGSGAILADDVINLAYDVPEQYEENLKFLFNKTNTMKYLRKIKDSNQRYMFGQGYNDSGMSVGKPTDLVGYPFQYTGFLPNITTGNVPIVFGDPTGYTLVNRLGFYVQVLREVAARRNQIILLGRVRFGGATTEPWKLRGLKIA